MDGAEGAILKFDIEDDGVIGIELVFAEAVAESFGECFKAAEEGGTKRLKDERLWSFGHFPTPEA